ncbi:PASTA domain containing protein [Prosthecochloris aestuarii DSM 271]|uniref:PASTA domain containing protein n=3 Tax=Prosthecochloris TaxID=1101 RepID=B4S829_PROA2|nr:PASTA domain containing protein [Prosthecochloris aestuarii DSM 271]
MNTMMKKAAVMVAVLLVLLLAVVLFIDKVVMPSYTAHGTSVLVPDVQKMQYDDAVRALRKSDLSAGKSFNVSYIRDIDSNMVIAQRPGAGSTVKPGRTVYLVVNKREKPEFTIPDFYGKPLDEVRQTLSRFDMTLRDVQEQVVYDPLEDGKVLGQSLPPSTVVSFGSSVSLIVGKLEESPVAAKIAVPNVLGLLLNDARQDIVDAGLNTGNVLYEYSSILVPNTVINQKPAANSLSEPGRVVELTIVITPD